MEETEDQLRDALERASLPYDMYADLAAYAEKKGLICFSTPSHIRDVHRLEKLDVPAFKFGSVQITDIPTIKAAAATGKPVLISTGASTMEDVARAVEAMESTGNNNFAILHCTSLYPCEDYSLIDLRVLATYQMAFDSPIGFSDHTLDPSTMPTAATALGVNIIEKHLTIDRTLEGPDHSFALEPEEFQQMVEAVRRTERALGSSYPRLTDAEREIARKGRRSLVTTRDIQKGEEIRKEDLTTKRPGTGIPPYLLDEIVGRCAAVDIGSNRVVKWEML